MCSGAGSGAAGSAVAGGAVDAGCLDPMLDRLLAVEVAGLPDSALAADLVGLRVAVSRQESEFARWLVVFDRRGAAGVTGAVSTAAWLRGACRLSAGEAGERVRTARVLAAAAPELPADALGALEPVLVEAARHADPARLRAVLADLRAQCCRQVRPGRGRGGRGGGARPAPADGGRHIRRRGGARRSTWRSPTPTTCGTGSTAAPPTWPTWRWSAGAITGWCTPAGLSLIHISEPTRLL